MIICLFYFLFLNFFLTIHSMDVRALPFIDRRQYGLGENKVNFWVVTEQCERDSQEDRVAVFSDSGKIGFGVYDGHGGSQVAEKLADDNTGLLATIINSNELLTEPLISRNFITYDKENFTKDEFTGSTAVTFFVDNLQKKIFMAYCGDSQGLLLDLGAKKAIYQTVDHDLFDATEKERVIRIGGFVSRENSLMVPEREDFYGCRFATLNMTRAFGDYAYRVFKKKNSTVLLKCPVENFIKEDSDQKYYRDFVHPFFSKCAQKVVISRPDIFECQLTDDPLLGVLYSDGFSNFFSSDGGEKNVEKKFLPCLASIIFMLINKGRKINSLAKDLISLMNTEKTLDEIIQTVNNGTIDFKKLRKQSTFFKSEDNVSLIVFCLEKNSSKLVSDSDVDSDNELDGYQEVLQDKEPILNVSDRVGTIIVEVEKVAEIKNYSVEKNQHGSIEKGNEQLFRNNQNIAVEDNFVQKEKNDPEIKSLENEPENRLKRFLKKLYPIRFSKGKVFLLSSFCLGLLAIVYYVKPQLFSRA